MVEGQGTHADSGQNMSVGKHFKENVAVDIQVDVGIEERELDKQGSTLSVQPAHALQKTHVAQQISLGSDHFEYEASAWIGRVDARKGIAVNVQGVCVVEC